ncbi:sugar transferase [Dictyobacter vulcani]|uniref:sugar transferase n=1 Tax=Dictyobacter vulcani TaxID=2607529 RepID=UPI0012503D1A|nr:sugar transferase [Dictyobacter vulcani]
MQPKLKQIIVTHAPANDHGVQHGRIKPERTQAVSTKGQLHTNFAQPEEISEILPVEQTISSFYLFWCMVINLIFGFFGLAIFLLILPIVALLIYCDSPGPIFYAQKRIGYKGTIFHMYKFRSMHVETSKHTACTRTIQDDPRVTRVGRFLRSKHLDELPQVLNILLGDMNLIGPRPEQPEVASMLASIIPLYQTRLRVKPGITGWAQVMYCYTNTVQGDAIKLKYDIYYIFHRSFFLDLLILSKTVIGVLCGHGR